MVSLSLWPLDTNFKIFIDFNLMMFMSILQFNSPPLSWKSLLATLKFMPALAGVVSSFSLHYFTIFVYYTSQWHLNWPIFSNNWYNFSSIKIYLMKQLNPRQFHTIQHLTIKSSCFQRIADSENSHEMLPYCCTHTGMIFLYWYIFLGWEMDPFQSNFQ